MAPTNSLSWRLPRLTPPPPSPCQIIHYDLKPANILMDNSKGVKVTDFGLSKVLSEEAAGPGATSMELTSQGAGTYWYLPPECFERQPRISNKVDVWSLGVIMFEMLYGRRPYGAGKSQEHVLRDGDILRARAVEFPAKPSVSEDAKVSHRGWWWWLLYRSPLPP